jgi:putative transposase
MWDYRRFFVPGGTYFFALVTERRARVFASAAARRLLGIADAIKMAACQAETELLAVSEHS